MTEGDREKVIWHISDYLARQICGLITKSTNFYLEGDLGQWYWTLTAMREMVNHELKSSEKQWLRGQEKKIISYLPRWKNHRKLLLDGKKANNTNFKADMTLQIKKYQRALMQLLKTLGYFPEKEDRTSLNF